MKLRFLLACLSLLLPLHAQAEEPVPEITLKLDELVLDLSGLPSGYRVDVLEFQSEFEEHSIQVTKQIIGQEGESVILSLAGVARLESENDQADYRFFVTYHEGAPFAFSVEKWGDVGGALEGIGQTLRFSHSGSFESFAEQVDDAPLRKLILEAIKQAGN